MAQFRGTVWPGVPLPEPWIYRPEVHVVGECLVWPNPLQGQGLSDYAGDASALPPELAIRELLALETRDTDAVLAFVRRYGWIQVAARMDRFLNDPFHAAGLFEQRLMGDWGGPTSDDLASAGLSCAPDEVASVVHLETAGRLLAEAQWCARVQLGDPDVELGQLRDVDIEGVYRHLMNLNLRHFVVRLVRPEVSIDNTFAGVETDLVDALFCQLVNLLIETTEYHRCPICATHFVRQRGRAKHGQHKLAGGVMYCSAGCANTASTRAYRARQRLEKGGI